MVCKQLGIFPTFTNICPSRSYLKKQLLPHLPTVAWKAVKKVEPAPTTEPIVAARGQPSEISGQEFEVRGQQFEMRGQVVQPRGQQEPLELSKVSMYGQVDDMEEGVHKEETQKEGARQ